MDQVILLNQAGKNTHEDICDSLRAVRPAGDARVPRGRAENHEAWKASVLAGETVLEDIDTEPFNVAQRQTPSLPSSKEARNMVSGAVGRPDSEAVSGG